MSYLLNFQGSSLSVFDCSAAEPPGTTLNGVLTAERLGSGKGIHYSRSKLHLVSHCTSLMSVLDICFMSLNPRTQAPPSLPHDNAKSEYSSLMRAFYHFIYFFIVFSLHYQSQPPEKVFPTNSANRQTWKPKTLESTGISHASTRARRIRSTHRCKHSCDFSNPSSKICQFEIGMTV